MAKKATLEKLSGLDALEDHKTGRQAAEEAQPAQEKPAKKEKKKSVQISAHIPKPLHTRIKVALARQDERLSLTELIIKLLDEWERTKR